MLQYLYAQHQKQFWLTHLGLPMLFALFMLVIYPHTQMDAQLIAPYFDIRTLSFPLKNNAFLENVMHQGLKNAVIVIPVVLLILWMLSFYFEKLKPQRRYLAWVFLAISLSTTSVTILKSLSNHACPWDLTVYGGSKPLLKMFESLPTGVKVNGCFPGGHASGGFALMAFYFAWRDNFPRLAQYALVFGLALGFIMGWAQMMRGAHFLSHNIWSAWVVWMVLLVFYVLWPPQAVKNT